MLKHIMLGIMLVSLVGCGCGDEGGGGGILPAIQPSSFTARSEFPPCGLPVEPTSNVVPIDVVFILDDSLFMNAVNGMGVIPNNPTDNRSRSVVAQRIFADLQARLRAQVEAAQQAGTLPQGVVFDFAYGVARYEDYGGATVDYLGNTGPIDAGARPFMMNMPLLREMHPDFQANFASALARTATSGDGNPTVNGFLRQDPQSAFEALFQASEGTGFNGDGQPGTLGNGLPCSEDAQGTGTPTTFKDVPAVSYRANGNDPQDATKPLFMVQGENGTDAGCLTSGNEGGMGWRPNSLRWAIITSDIASVSPFVDAQGMPAAPPPGSAVQPTPTQGSPFVLAPAFNGVTGRFGEAQPPKAPLGAATVQETIYALNARGIEVLCLGAPGVQPGQTKPNLPGANPTQEIEAIENPDSPAFTPFTWMSAVSILTNSRIEDHSNPDGSNAFNRLFPAVFNLGNVGLLDQNNQDPLIPTMFATNVNDDLLLGMMDRIRDRAAGAGGGTGGTFPQLPTLTIQMSFEVMDNQLTLPFARQLPNPATTTVTVPVQVPVHYVDITKPLGDPQRNFTVDAGGNPVFGTPNAGTASFGEWSWLLGPPDAPVPQSDTFPYTVRAFITDPNAAIGNVLPGQNDAQVAQLRQKIGDFGAFGQGVVQLTGWPTSQGQPLPRAAEVQAGSHTGWCIRFDDTSWGAGMDFAEELHGSCDPSPLPQP